MYLNEKDRAFIDILWGTAAILVITIAVLFIALAIWMVGGPIVGVFAIFISMPIGAALALPIMRRVLL